MTLALPLAEARARLPKVDLLCLSPHLDDGVLSCGGVLARAVAEGAVVLVVTVFAGDAPAEALARPQVRAVHARWKLPHAAAVAARRAEDAAACAMLGVHAAWAPLPDHLYWRWAGAWNEPTRARRLMARLRSVLLPGRRRAERERAAAVRDVVSLCAGAWPDASILAPLAAGGHPDHRLVRTAASVLPPTRLAWYEDLPYAAAGPLAACDSLELRPAPIASSLAVKQEAFACYVSQFAEITGGRGASAIAAWAGVPPCERLHRAPEAPRRPFLG